MDQDIVVRILPLLPSYEEVLKSMIEYWLRKEENERINQNSSSHRKREWEWE